MPSLVVERGGRFGARLPARRGAGYRWLGTRDTREEAEALIAAARSPRRQSREPKKGWVVPPSVDEVLAVSAVFGDHAMRVFSLVAAFSGLRLFEVARLNVADVDLEHGRLVVTRGKGGYEDETSLLFEPGLSALAEFMPERGRIFSTSVGTPFDRRHVARLWKPVARDVGISCTFHGLRHFHTCWLIDQGASDADVAIQLRHHDNGELVRRRYGRYRSTVEALRRLDGLR